MPRTYGTSNVVAYSAAPPVGPEGDTYYDTTTDTLYVSDGTAWKITIGPSMITGNELALLAVTTTKINANAVIMNKLVAAGSSPATIARIAAGGGNYSEIGGAPVIVCTSSTRPTGVVGLSIYETDTHKFLVYASGTVGWQPPWNTAWGRIGYFQRTTDVSNFVGTDVQYSQSVNVSVPANRLLRIESGWRSANSAAANGAGFIRIRSGGITLQEVQVFANASNVGSGGYISCFHSPPSGTTTYFMTGTSVTSTIGIQASTTYPHWLSVTDVGPSANPA